MRENKVKTLWQEGKAVINGWLGIPSSIAAENMAQAGWDALTCDLQHGLVDYSTAVPMLQAISTTQATPLARVPWNEPGIIMKMLDAIDRGEGPTILGDGSEAFDFVAVEDCARSNLCAMRSASSRTGWST